MHGKNLRIVFDRFCEFCENISQNSRRRSLLTLIINICIFFRTVFERASLMRSRMREFPFVRSTLKTSRISDPIKNYQIIPKTRATSQSVCTSGVYVGTLFRERKGAGARETRRLFCDAHF